MANSVARAVMLDKSPVTFPAASTAWAMLSPVKTMVQARLPNSSVTWVLRWLMTVSGFPSNVTVVERGSCAISAGVGATAISRLGTSTWRWAVMCPSRSYTTVSTPPPSTGSENLPASSVRQVPYSGCPWIRTVTPGRGDASGPRTSPVTTEKRFGS